jgi:zinc transporter ZupT
MRSWRVQPSVRSVAMRALLEISAVIAPNDTRPTTSGLTILVGALIAYALSGALDVALLLPFAAGNFLYIGASDLLPQLRSEALGEELVQFGVFCAGLLMLGLLAAACATG